MVNKKPKESIGLKELLMLKLGTIIVFNGAIQYEYALNFFY